MGVQSVPVMAALASRAKTKVKHAGIHEITNLSSDEILALVFVADCFLADYSGPLTRGAPEILTHPITPEET